jgi:hypothetical protein
MPGSEPVTRLLAAITKATLLPAIYLYFTGFIYAYFYFKNFGISLRFLNEPVYAFLVYSFTVFWAHPLFAVLLCIGAAVLVKLVRRTGKTGSLVLTLIALFPICYELALHTANRHALTVRAGRFGNHVKLSFRSTAAATLPRDFLAQNDNGQLVLLVDTDKQAFLLYQSNPAAPRLGQAAVYVLPKDNLSLATITIDDAPNPDPARRRR